MRTCSVTDPKRYIIGGPQPQSRYGPATVMVREAGVMRMVLGARMAAAVTVGLLLLGLTAGKAGWAQGTAQQTAYQNITPGQMQAMLQRKDFAMVNVHIPYEGEITGTDLFVPYNQIEQNITRLPADKGARIVLYCRSGSMSTTASKTLVRMGFTNVSNLAGGMIEWKRQGYPVINTASN